MGGAYAPSGLEHDLESIVSISCRRAISSRSRTMSTPITFSAPLKARDPAAHLADRPQAVELLLAHPAFAAGDVEGDDHAVARLQLLDAGADLLDDPHRLLAEDVALFDEHAQHLVEVEVRAADRGRGDAHDRVGRLLDRRVRDLVDAESSAASQKQRGQTGSG
jgi:hypothetical protein